MKIVIVGHGFVGKAVDASFKETVEKLVIDPKYGNDINDIKKFDADFAFISVPTPMRDDGQQDSSIALRVIEEIQKIQPRCKIVVKSTILPNFFDDLRNKEHLIYNPEFLREKSAVEDFINAKFHIFGGNRNDCESASKLYKDYSKCLHNEHYFTDIKTASLIKYTINCFLASKVLFFNKIYDLKDKLNVNDSWEEIINIISLDERIGRSHMDIPGHDGRRGFGGACFPKDTFALLKLFEHMDIENTTLKSTIEENNKYRSLYSDLNEREKDQNVNFKVK